MREFFNNVRFARGSTIDGNVIDLFMQAVIDRMNKLKHKDIERRWFETQIVAAFNASKLGSLKTRMPWCLGLNDSVKAIAPPEYYPLNRYRVRGTETPGIIPEKYEGSNLTYEISFATTGPTIITGLTMMMRTGGTDFANSFKYGTPPPPWKTTGDWVDDFQMELSVDNPFVVESAQRQSCEVLRRAFPAGAWFNSQVNPPSGVMLPQHNIGERPSGCFVTLDLHVAIPAASRVRAKFTVPNYPNTFSSGWNGGSDDDQAMDRSGYTMTIRMLEAIR